MTDTAQPELEPKLPSYQVRRRRIMYGLIIVATAAYATFNINTTKPLLSANDRSRWCTVWSLVERGTYRIDEINQNRKWQTIDRVTLDGALYSTKPPLLATLVAGLYWSVKQTTGLNLLDNTAQVTRGILMVVNLVPFIAALIVLAMFVERYARTDFARYYVLTTAAVGTLLTTFLVTLNNHSPAAASVLFAIYPAVRILSAGERRPLLFAIAGFFAAWTCTNELPAALFGVALFGMLFRKAPRQTLFYFVPVALIPLAAFFVTNEIATGRWQPLYTLYGTDAYLKNPDGSPTHWANPNGIDKGGDAPSVYLLHCTVGHHGIFSLSPVFLLALAGWLRMWRTPASTLRPLLWLGLGLTVAILGFYLTRTQNYNYGGVTSGLRWTFWLIPFWLVAMIPTLDQFGSRRGFQVLAVILLLISIFSAVYPRTNPWRHPWLFQLLQHWEWIDYSQTRTTRQNLLTDQRAQQTHQRAEIAISSNKSSASI